MTSDGPVSESGNNHKKEGCFVALGLILAVVGTGLLVWAIASALFALEARSWKETPCRILTAQIDKSHADNHVIYRADFTYEYQVDGVKHVGDRDRIVKTFGSLQPAKDRLSALPVGTETVCHVDPDDPTEAVLDASFSIGTAIGMCSIGLFIGLIGCVVALSGFKAMRGRSRLREPQLPVSGQVSSLAGRDDYFQSDVIDRD